ncbi:hypothetical protein [Allorhodopirellula heiligendammensis]|uniref:Uncharacterized protein n=1 Tax=Allorhodopirellula heiligendammensis TaxID=2714739 RepID=A0A5C6C6H8_9BACT|nr:hypothetical protein [Allorhodopirellula heiligendammensis]TWU19672.1 hypothetical protein Poly21_18470 [Allorhodopirellula heiligendammensis]
MMRKTLLSLALVAASACGGVTGTSSAQAGDFYGMTNIWNMNYAQTRPWHGNYYYAPYGQPTALVAPPTVSMRQTYSWGVSQNLMYPVHSQFGRSATQPGAAAPGQFLATPNWPSHTDQYGIYYVRGPW